MIQVKQFTFNAFQENTYVLYHEAGSCLIIDPGCNDHTEQGVLTSFIESKGVLPERLLNTHCHIDHILGNAFVAEKYGLTLEIPKGELPLLQFAELMGKAYGITLDPPPEPGGFLEEGDKIIFGDEHLEILHTPGHSPASVCLYAPKSAFAIVGDVLFAGSIGRTDLPGGDYATLISSIQNKLLVLPDETTVYPGHGPATTIGTERRNNPFLQG